MTRRQRIRVDLLTARTALERGTDADLRLALQCLHAVIDELIQDQDAQDRACLARSKADQ